MFRLILLCSAFLAAPVQSEDSPKLLKGLLDKIADDYLKYGMDGIIKNIKDEWSDFLHSFGKEYPPQEDAFRRWQFERNKRSVERINKLHAEGKLSFEVALNDKADLTQQEYNALNGQLQLNETEMEKFSNHSRRVARAVGALYKRDQYVPERFSWVDKGFVTPVKQQGVCGSCWAFASAAALEAHNKFLTGQLINMSPQNILDCTWRYQNFGCGGGVALTAFKWAQMHGINVYDDYPYVGNASRYCRQIFERSVAKTDGYITVPSGDEQALKIALATLGPVTVAIDARSDGFKFYRRGIYGEPSCTTSTTHVMLLVGYGTDPKFGDFWIVKNSWGLDWGMNGYGYIARNRNSMCGIASYAALPYRLPF